MDFASEIGQKMRSAVKAKLLELGTGGSAAYIDDELPDYVMIMVANKRSKQQMITDLNLFLGNQTELFVTWLHEVLQKLQEVTLPAASSSSKKRKSHQGSSETSIKRDKKIGKKDKRAPKKTIEDVSSPDGEKPSTTTETVLVAEPAIESITEVFAGELLEKAKKTLDVTISMKDEIRKKKQKRSVSEQHTEADTQQQNEVPKREIKSFDIPTISEISSTTGGNGKDTNSVNREKDLAELAQIQKKIQAAKLHLRNIGELDAEDESEDEDFLNLKDDEQENVEKELSETEVDQTHQNYPKKVKSPVVFNRSTITPEPPPKRQLEMDMKASLPDTHQNHEKERTQNEREKRIKSEERNERRSVHERLGIKTLIVQEKRVRQQKELYVPAYRRKEFVQEKESGTPTPRYRERSRESRRSHERSTSRRLRTSPEMRTRQRRPTSSESPQKSPKNRIVSRVIVAPSKPLESSDDDSFNEKPVSSVIKIKPRPAVSPRRQACKNLLMRAVADAQRSTILMKSSETKLLEPEVSTSTANRNISERGKKLYTKSYRERERVNKNEPSVELFRRTTRNLVVELKNADGTQLKRHISREQSVDEVHEEYVPEMLIDGDESQTDFDIYVPQAIERIDVSEDNEGAVEEARQNTQFVVTLYGDKVSDKYRKRSTSSRKHSLSPLPQVSSSSGSLPNNGIEASSTTCSRRRKPDTIDKLSLTEKLKRTECNSPSSSNTPPHTATRSLKRSEVLRQTKEIKKIIIQNDSDEDEELSARKALALSVQQKRHTTKRHSDSNVNGFGKKTDDSPIFQKPKSIRTKDKNEQRSTTPPLPPKKYNARDSVAKPVSISGNESTLQAKLKHTPIKFVLKDDARIEQPTSPKRRRIHSAECNEHDQHPRASSNERRKISIRTSEDKKYDNIPSLSALTVDSLVMKVVKPKERCKYHPNCTKQFCDFYHPTAPCKSFPNCKFADKCLYTHPKCKYDLACMSIDCNYAHSGPRDLNHAQLTAPPLSSHVIPVQNYKSISATSAAVNMMNMCKYFPNCTKASCTFYHPKPCRYGKNCINKLECTFFHPEMQSSNKFKWVASVV